MSIFRRWKPSLQIRVLLLAILIVTAVLAASDKFSLWGSMEALENEISAQTRMTAFRIAQDLRNTRTERLAARFRRSLDKILELVPNITRVDVLIRQGDEVKTMASTAVSERDLEDCEREAFDTGLPDSCLIEDEHQHHRVLAVVPLHLPKTQALVTAISTLKPVADLPTVNRRLRIYLLAGTILCLVIGVQLLFRTTVYRSIRHLVNTMHAFQAGNAAVRVTPRLPGEFGELARQLNRMLDELTRFHGGMQQKIREATEALANRNRELENLNLQLYQTQKRLSQVERLAVIGQLTATFAHEIGSPLSAVSAHLQILLEASGLKERFKERLLLADREIRRVCGIVETLLADTRSPGSFLSVDVAETIRHVARLLGPTLQARCIAFEFLEEAKNLRVLGNPDQLQQLFLNLFNNALDAIQTAAGRIEIRAGRSSPGRLCITVTDSGEGISPDKYGHIFEPFFTTKEFGKGSGLGLAVCREIVQHHGGLITAANGPQGRGALFTLMFPEKVSASA
jgi:signal transduction histidine kinase